MKPKSTKSKDPLGDRIKNYEKEETSKSFLPFIPVYARIDGRNFSKFTKDLDTPFDKDFKEVMVETTKNLVEATNAKIGYTQSDEISLCWCSEKPNEEIFFAGKKQKMISQLASLTTMFFMKSILNNEKLRSYVEKSPTFDARVFQIPNKSECINAFLWRQRDATKNALSMAARSIYPHSKLLNKNQSELNELLFQKGINFNDYDYSFKRGVFVQKREVLHALSDKEFNQIPEKNRPPKDLLIKRNKVHVFDLHLDKVENKMEVFFENKDPVFLNNNNLKIK